ncbi:hypothetical protein GIB67_022556 [Kingdonia uniflora]|uniref:Neprosin PEP catalytic domain-containing protein n=1 Tax=Kingdonia uniflora TaxID=39325 RepID=A0A7J7L7G5_9MAGN|nr:hypothetical protein GIB67_022556 [Kingdonia uniflora]
MQESVVIVMLLLLLVYRVVGESIVLSEEGFKSERPVSDGRVVETQIKSKHGVYDCVDVHKQPSLDHPLLKNHTIQVRPSTALRNMSHEASLKSGHSTTKGIYTKTNGPQKYHGVTAVMSVYNPAVKSQQFSGAEISVEVGPPDQLNYIRAGWMVNHLNGGDTRTRVFISWSAGSKDICFNSHCNGFISVSRNPIDMVIDPTSVKRTNLVGLPLTICQDSNTRNWWLLSEGNYMGYWPKEILPQLSNGGDSIKIGGRVYAQDLKAFPPMGSGHWKNTDYTWTAYFNKIYFYDGYRWFIPDNAYIDAIWYGSYYRAADNSFKQGDKKYSFVYGGPNRG